MLPPLLSLEFILPDEAATLQLAQRFAKQLFPGMVAYLYGDLGAGKTTFTRGVLQGLGFNGRVKSPTYTLLEPYQIGCHQIRHFDLYRLNDPEEWEAAGFRDELNGESILLIEWPEKGAGLLPPPDLTIQLNIESLGRTATLAAFTSAGQRCLATL